MLFNIPLSIYLALGFLVLLGLFASATLLASKGRKLEDVGNPYQNFLYAKMLRLTENDEMNLIIFSFFVVLLWPFHVVLLAFGLFYNK